ncbi:FusB/FusC family EF-G-binding protein [Peribacillus frigoritolerans]|uniref:FusB/FusC family EF-G-binding protein n=1 Tax=Peribacillus frigoritolerans TaxID=450367 RepID=UPI00105A505F|nr:FusB/FusC family EF-G-binding protein [Peribacillus frigoritolerans]TDL76408.1 elongation factor G-binding protein [Peribacillus frigoritolerans]
MEPFIRSDQYNYIKAQTQLLVNGYGTVNDPNVLNALKSLALERTLTLFDEIEPEQIDLLSPINAVKDKSDADVFLLRLKPFVIPFKHVTEQTIKKLFPKAKKIKAPSSLEELDFTEISYLSWHDKGSGKQYIIAPQSNKLIGLQGTFSSIHQKGICTICNRFEEAGMFTAEIKGAEPGTFIKRGNYICQDPYTCNQNITSMTKLNEFLALMKNSTLKDRMSE